MGLVVTRRVLLADRAGRRCHQRRRPSPRHCRDRSALVAHPRVAEAAVVGFPHDIKGQGIYAYVTLKISETPSEELRRELVAWVRQEISPIAAPDLLQWAPGLPKTRSGKIMRRILRKIAANEHDALGDVTALADPTVVDELVDNRMNRGRKPRCKKLISSATSPLRGRLWAGPEWRCGEGRRYAACFSSLGRT